MILGLQLSLEIIWEQFYEIFLLHIRSDILERVLEPLVMVHSKNVARYHEGIEDGVVFGASVVLAEQKVFAAQSRRALSAFHGIVVDQIFPVFSIALDAVP